MLDVFSSNVMLSFEAIPLAKTQRALRGRSQTKWTTLLTSGQLHG